VTDEIPLNKNKTDIDAEGGTSPEISNAKITPAETQAPEYARPSIWQLALPSILGNLSYTVVGMVQTKFVGELGPQALAAVGAGQRVMFAMLAILMAVSAGTTALVARAWGAGDYEEASRVTMASLVLGCALSLVVATLGFFFAGSLAGVFGLDEQTLAMATENIRLLAFFNVAFAGMLILGAALRASGDAWTPLWISGGVNLLNLPLLYAFIFGHWGMPQMGVAFTIGSLVQLILWVKQKFRVRHVVNGWWRKARLRQLLDIGYPAALEQGVFQLGFFIFLIVIGKNYGTEAFAAYNIGVNILAVCMTIGFGFSIAGSTLVGQHLGAKDFEGAARSGWRSLWLAVVSMGSVGLLVVSFAQELAEYFIGDGALTIVYTVQFIYVLGAMMPLLAVEFALGGALRGAGDTRFPLITTVLGLLVMRCGLAAIAAYLGAPVIWVYAALIGDYVLKSVLLIWRFRQGRWKTVVPKSYSG
jgi:putative MATE family efflux protein